MNQILLPTSVACNTFNRWPIRRDWFG